MNGKISQIPNEADIHKTYSEGSARLAYGELPNGRLVHIGVVASGIACGCTCPGCGKPLIAKKGEQNVNHFAHMPGIDPCSLGRESMLHKLGKQIIADNKKLLVPPVALERSGVQWSKFPAMEITFDEVKLEQPLGPYVPDVTAARSGRTLLVEILVSHKCEDAKVRWLKRNGYSCIEVDINGAPLSAGPDEVERYVLEGAPRTWISNPRLEEGERYIAKELDERQREAEERKRMERQQELSALVASFEAAQREVGHVPTSQCQLVRWAENKGFSDLLDLGVGGGDAFFRVSPRTWRAYILNWLFNADDEEIDTKAALSVFRGKGWIREDFLNLGPDERAALRPVGYPYGGFPKHVAAFFENLSYRFPLERHNDGWRLDGDARVKAREVVRQDKAHSDRVMWVSKCLKEIMDSIDAASRAGFDADSWFTGATLSMGMTPYQAVLEGGEPYGQFLERLREVTNAVTLYGDTPEDYLELPVEQFLTRRNMRLQEFVEDRWQEEFSALEGLGRDGRLPSLMRL